MFEITTFLYAQFDDIETYGNPATDYKVNCPFCGIRSGKDDTKHKLHVGMEKEVVHCFRCGYKAGWIRFVQDVTGCGYHQAIGELYKPPKIREKSFTSETAKLSVVSADAHRPTVGMPEDFVPLCEKHAENSNHTLCRKYMRKRGFSKWYWQRYSLGSSLLVPMRVIIPIEEGYYQARSVVSWQEPKYINPKVEARHFIFNSPALEMYDEVIICEGAFSAMAVGENAIALIAKEYPKEKLQRLLFSSASKFIVALDFGAEDKAVGLADYLMRAGKEVHVWDFKNEKDPADGGKYESIDYDGFAAKMRLLMK
jgi:hypothetical protein